MPARFGHLLIQRIFQPLKICGALFTLFNKILSVLFEQIPVTVAPRYNELRYNEDPVRTKNIWKPGRIRVKYVETNPVKTNPAITKSPL